MLTACAGRSPDPVALVQAQDTSASCTAIQAELAANTTKISELGKDQGKKVAQNVAAGVAGLFIPVLWFAMDFQGTAGKEITALEQRNAYLAQTALERCDQIDHRRSTGQLARRDRRGETMIASASVFYWEQRVTCKSGSPSRSSPIKDGGWPTAQTTRQSMRYWLLSVKS